MLPAKERAKLITSLNTLLTLYVLDKESKRLFAEKIARDLDVAFKAHFVEACLAE